MEGKDDLPQRGVAFIIHRERATASETALKCYCEAFAKPV